MDKLHEYEGFAGRIHGVRETIKERWGAWKEWKNGLNLDQGLDGLRHHLRGPPKLERTLEDYSHIYRRKTRAELIRISTAVMGIEFSYAAETAFVSPTLLKIGVDHQRMTLVWALSPLVGFFVTPILGSISDRCKFKHGRRRPFILLLALGVFIGKSPVWHVSVLKDDTEDYMCAHLIQTRRFPLDIAQRQSWPRRPLNPLKGLPRTPGVSSSRFSARCYSTLTLMLVKVPRELISSMSLYPVRYSDIFYKFDLMRVLVYFILELSIKEFAPDPQLFDHSEEPVFKGSHVNYGFENETNPRATLKEYLLSIVYMPHSLRQVYKSNIFDRQVCLTNLFCWMAHVCYSLYFTDFVGEAVYGGNPRAPADTDERELYEEGVRFGCWGMSMYSLSCSCYSLIIERLIERFRARKVYIYGLLFYSVGMLLMALTKHQVGVIVFSWTAGVMYSTLFTMPYLLVAHYHTSSTFALTSDEGDAVSGGFVRGLGTDIAIVSSMVFLAQFLLSCCLGTIVSLTGSTAAVVYVASILAMCGAACAARIMYLDL